MKYILGLLLFGLTSCQMVNDKIDEKQRVLEGEVKRLDSIVNKELEMIHSLDSLVHKEKDIIDSLLKR
jgi:hypothetical protein